MSEGGPYVMTYERSAYPSGHTSRDSKRVLSRARGEELIAEWNRLGRAPHNAPIWSYRLLSVRYQP